MKNYLKLMRPQHYVKNFLVFFPLFFGGHIRDPVRIHYTIICYISFCLLSSGVYAINDIIDVEKDRAHSTKNKRPIASGAILIKHASIFSAFLCINSFLILYVNHAKIMCIILLVLYFLNNIAYSVFGIKNIPLVDIGSIVIGFCLRMFAGSVSAGVLISDWLYLVIISGSFYLAIGKRLKEKQQTEGFLQQKRIVLDKYPSGFLRESMYMCMCLTIVFYTFWCIDDSVSGYLGGNLIWTVPLVIMIAMKYTMDLETAEEGDPTTIILRDKILLFLGFVLFMILTCGIYGTVLV